MCWMSKSLVPVLIFFSLLWPYIVEMALKFPNSPRCGNYLHVPICWFVPTTELKSKFWEKYFREF